MSQGKAEGAAGAAAPGAAGGPETPQSAEYDATAARIAEEFAGQLIDGGMQRMPARVFACLFVTDSAVLTSGELSERLQISPAAVSGAVAYLSQVHLVTRERQPGSRRERYRLHHSLWYEAMSSRDTTLSRWAATMREGEEEFGLDRPAGRRMRETREFLEFMREAVAASMERWREIQAARREPDDPR